MKKYIKPTLDVAYIESQGILEASPLGLPVDITSEDTYDLGGALSKRYDLWEDEEFE